MYPTQFSDVAEEFQKDFTVSEVQLGSSRGTIAFKGNVYDSERAKTWAQERNYSCRTAHYSKQRCEITFHFDKEHNESVC